MYRRYISTDKYTIIQVNIQFICYYYDHYVEIYYCLLQSADVLHYIIGSHSRGRGPICPTVEKMHSFDFFSLCSVSADVFVKFSNDCFKE